MRGPSSALTRGRVRLAAAAAALAAGAAIALPLAPLEGQTTTPNRFEQVNLVSDIPGAARLADPNLVNPWGLSAGPTTPLWVSNEVTGTSTLYRGDGKSTPPSQVPLVVTIPGGHPTGQVFNNSSGFKIGSDPARFIFASLSGRITGWTGTTGPGAATAATVPGAVYTGLAEGKINGHPFLYAANFAAATVDVFNETFTKTTLAGGFVDPNLPAGFAPFGIQRIGSRILVAYAEQGEGGEEEVGPGLGYVDAYSLDGHLLRRLISQGDLNAPWGIAIAPSSFGPFGNALLVGNFGDGAIHAYNAGTGAHLGQLLHEDGSKILIPGLWGLRFGNGSNGGGRVLFFAAGIDDEEHGLLGTIFAD